VNARGKDGWTPLLSALNVSGNTDVLRLLLEKGAGLDAKDDEGTTVWDMAEGDPEVESLLKSYEKRREKK
jgi:ankyrin repeat protein